MAYEFRYAVQDFHGDGEDDYTCVLVDYNYDLEDPMDLDGQELAERCAADHWQREGGYESSITVSVWKCDRSQKKTYDIWVELVPRFSAREVKS